MSPTPSRRTRSSAFETVLRERAEVPHHCEGLQEALNHAGLEDVLDYIKIDPQAPRRLAPPRTPSTIHAATMTNSSNTALTSTFSTED